MLAHMIDVRPKDLPRSTSRKDWQHFYRSLRQLQRIVERNMRENEARLPEMISDMLIYGTAHTLSMEGTIERIVNPPIAIHSIPRGLADAVYGRVDAA